ncbi:hypothetical protein F7Q92_21460, partial [Ideonella dechloratans]
MLSAFSVEHCPPSWWNTVRHQRGIVSAIAWNTQKAQIQRAFAGGTAHVQQGAGVGRGQDAEAGSRAGKEAQQGV